MEDGQSVSFAEVPGDVRSDGARAIRGISERLLERTVPFLMAFNQPRARYRGRLTQVLEAASVAVEILGALRVADETLYLCRMILSYLHRWLLPMAVSRELRKGHRILLISPGDFH